MGRPAIWSNPGIPRPCVRRSRIYGIILEEAERIGRNGRALVAGKYSSAAFGEHLVSIIGDLMADDRAPRVPGNAASSRLRLHSGALYRPYRWVAPFMAECLDRFWAEHPPVYFCGLEPSEAKGLPMLPLRSPAPPRDWVLFLRDAVEDVTAAGFTKCYLLLEEHLALATCAAQHLNETLPRLMDDLGAVCIGLMGWDNRRYTTRAPILDASRFHLMHLSTERAPRFHLHPSLWSLEVLRGCLDLVARDATHTPWRFEKVLEKWDADLPETWKNGCYQVCGRAMAHSAPRALARSVDHIVDACYHRAMALFPHLPSAPAEKASAGRGASIDEQDHSANACASIVRLSRSTTRATSTCLPTPALRQASVVTPITRTASRS